MKIEEALANIASESIFFKMQTPSKSRTNQRIDLEHTVNRMLIRAPYLLSDIIYFQGGGSHKPTESFVLIKIDQYWDTFPDAPGISIVQRWKVCGNTPLTPEQADSIGKLTSPTNYFKFDEQINALRENALDTDSPFDFCKYVDVKIAVRRGTTLDVPNNDGNTGSYHYNSHHYRGRQPDWAALNASRGFNSKNSSVTPYGDYAMILDDRGAQLITVYGDEPSPLFVREVEPSLFKPRVKNRLTKKEKVWSGWIPDQFHGSETAHTFVYESGSVEVRKLDSALLPLPNRKTKIDNYFVDMILVIPSESQVTLGSEKVILSAGQYMFDFKVPRSTIMKLTKSDYGTMLNRLKRKLKLKAVVSRLNALTKMSDEEHDSKHAIKARPIQKQEDSNIETSYTRVNANRLK